MVIAGGFSIGMVFAFLAYKTQFLTAGASLITKASDFKMLGLHLERLSDIALAQEDQGFLQEQDAGLELKGAVSLKGVSYRYGVEEPLGCVCI